MKKHIVYIIGVLIAFGLGAYAGVSYEKSKHESKIVQSTETLKKHEKEIEIINTEPDSAAVKRFHENFGTGSK